MCGEGEQLQLDLHGGPVFYLGTHMKGWLWSHPGAAPMFVSRRRLERDKSLPRARGPWALDSGGFTELSEYGRWLITASEYVRMVRRYEEWVGRMDWAAPMDWMCEPEVLAKTGLSVGEHQRRTVANFLELRELAPELPFIPVLQGWVLDDYERCAELYAAAGVDLRDAPVVGIGSVCRRQATSETEAIVRRMAAHGLRLHAFGVKKLGLAKFADAIVSADSMAWSFEARRSPPLPFCKGKHLNCANCFEFARRWRDDIQLSLERRSA